MTALVREAIPLALASSDDRIVAAAVFVLGFGLGAALVAWLRERGL